MISLTPAAVTRLQALALERGLSVPRLRLGTVPGSYSGHQYAMRLEGEAAPADLVFSCEGAEVIVDADSLSLLEGVEVDYEDTLMRSGFVVHNPNAASHCTCGRSFQTAPDAAFH